MECDAVAMQWSAVQWQCSEVQWGAVHCCALTIIHNGVRSVTVRVGLYRVQCSVVTEVQCSGVRWYCSGFQWSAVRWQCSGMRCSGNAVQCGALLCGQSQCNAVSHSVMRSVTMEEWNAAIAVCEWSGLDYLVPISGRVVALNNEFVT